MGWGMLAYGGSAQKCFLAGLDSLKFQLLARHDRTFGDLPKRIIHFGRT